MDVEGRGASGRRATDYERNAAIADLLEESRFELRGRRAGPYRLAIAMQGTRLAFHVADAGNRPIVSHLLSVGPLRAALRDYAMLRDAYHLAVESGDARRIETIDMGRRAAHDGGARLLRERLAANVLIDLDTARGLFAIVAAAPSVMAACGLGAAPAG